jgi:hypothetical protein
MYNNVFVFPCTLKVFCDPRQFLVLADEMFDMFGDFAATIMICENPMRENFCCGTVPDRLQTTLASLFVLPQTELIKWLTKKERNSDKTEVRASLGVAETQTIQTTCIKEETLQTHLSCLAIAATLFNIESSLTTPLF